MNSKRRTVRSGRHLLWLPAVLFALALLAAACGDESTTSDTSTTAADDDSTGDDLSDAEAALEAAADELVVVCADQDRDRLHDMSGEGTKARIGERSQLFSTVDDLTVVDRTISIDGDAATVTVTLDVTIDGETSQVERTWTYENVDGEWVLADVPDCLFS